MTTQYRDDHGHSTDKFGNWVPEQADLDRFMGMTTEELHAELQIPMYENPKDRLVLIKEALIRQHQWRDKQAGTAQLSPSTRFAAWQKETGWRSHRAATQGNARQAERDRVDAARMVEQQTTRFAVAFGVQLVDPSGKVLMQGAAFDAQGVPAWVVEHMTRVGLLNEIDPSTLATRVSSEGYEYVVSPSMVGVLAGRAAGSGIDATAFATPEEPPSPPRKISVPIGPGREVMSETHGFPGRPASDGKATFDAFVKRGLIVRNPRHQAPAPAPEEPTKSSFFSKRKSA